MNRVELKPRCLYLWQYAAAAFKYDAARAATPLADARWRLVYQQSPHAARLVRNENDRY
jgi:hypothetical protein